MRQRESSMLTFVFCSSSPRVASPVEAQSAGCWIWSARTGDPDVRVFLISLKVLLTHPECVAINMIHGDLWILEVLFKSNVTLSWIHLLLWACVAYEQLLHVCPLDARRCLERLKSLWAETDARHHGYLLKTVSNNGAGCQWWGWARYMGCEQLVADCFKFFLTECDELCRMCLPWTFVVRISCFHETWF